MVVLVTGANGQLGQSIQFISKNYPNSSLKGELAEHIEFVFCNSQELDITNLNNIKLVFEQFKPNYCINTAAYTAVDKAENETEKAHLINVIGAKNLAEVCKDYDTTLIHISTDFVFDGNLSPRAQSRGYTEEDIPNPTGIYGQTKLDGEKAIQQILEKYYIIRTSWVYSQFGNNFMKTMLRLASERDSLSVVNDQIGTPTNAVDLAEAIVTIILHRHTELADCPAEPVEASIYGIYNFSNEGKCSWYDFAKKIFEINNIEIDLQPIPTKNYPTPAKRPKYSVLDKSKIKNVLGIEIRSWEESLKNLY